MPPARLTYAAAFCLTAAFAASAAEVPSLVGTWTGTTDSVSVKFGMRTRERTVHITEQTDRRFRGYFDYEAGRKDFFGVVFPDNTSFAWVSTTSKGDVQGRILAPDHIAACYIEPGPEASAGCSDLTRSSPKP
jgi:hypothetical protein